MADYNITVVNNSSAPGTYVVFQVPAPGAVALTGWSVRETIAPGASAEVSFTPPPPPKPAGLLGKLCALLLRTPPSVAPGQFRLTVDAGAPQAGPHIDFSASPTASTKIVHGLDGALSVAPATTLGYSSFVTPVGNVFPSDQGDNFVGPFAVSATFTNSAGGGCENGEYRQLVKGQFSVDGSVLTHFLCGSTPLSPAAYQEDGCPPGACTAFGYRACPAISWSQYTPDQATSARFAMYDQPGFVNLASGNTYSVYLQFQGQLVDTATGATLAAQAWSVEGQMMAPERMVDTLHDFQPSDRLVGVHLSRNLADDGPEVHVVIARAPGSPRLDPNAVKLTLVDAKGQPVATAEPAAHEVGGHRGTTASIVHHLLSGQGTPVKATLDIGGQVTELAIAAAAAGAHERGKRAMTTYTISVFNQSSVSKSYVVFMQPPGGVTPIYTNVWARSRASPTAAGTA